MEPQPATVVIREGAPPLGTTHYESLVEAEKSEDVVEAQGAALGKVLDLAVAFAAFLHQSSHPLFLHALRLMLTYQEKACAGCDAGTKGVSTMFTLRPPSEEALLAVIGRDTWEGAVDPATISAQLADILKAMGNVGAIFEVSDEALKQAFIKERRRRGGGIVQVETESGDEGDSD